MHWSWLQHIPKVWVLLVRQIHECQPVSFLLIHHQALSFPVFAREKNVQCHCCGDGDAITSPVSIAHIAASRVEPAGYPPNDQPCPQLRIVICLLLTLDELWSHNIPHAVGYENSSSHCTLLRSSRNIAHPDDNGLADDCSKCANDRVSRHRRGGMIGPLGLPDHRTAGYHRETVYDKQNEANVSDSRRKIAAKKNGDETQAAQRKLPQD